MGIVALLTTYLLIIVCVALGTFVVNAAAARC
jgi:hypothetical protein